MGSGEPRWIGDLDQRMSTLFAGRGVGISIALAVLCVIIGFAVFARWDISGVLVIAILLAAWIWLAEDFGGILTGSGTDVNSGPLLILLALTYWRPRPLHRSPELAHARGPSLT